MSIEIDDTFYHEEADTALTVVAVCGRAVGVSTGRDMHEVRWLLADDLNRAISSGELRRLGGD